MAAVYASTSNQVAALKELYTGDDFMKDLVYKRNPALALLKKDESPGGFAGKYIPVPLVYGTPQGRSAAFTSAQDNQTAASLASFFVYRVKNYQIVTIDNELLEATVDDAGAFVEQAKLQMDTGFQNISNDLAHDLFSDGSGSRGTYGLANGSISTGVITLDDPESVVFFEKGMSLVSYSVSGSTPTQSTSAAVGYVIAVNRSAGIVTVSATQGGAAGTPANWSTSFPYLAQLGDVNFVSNGLLSANMRKLSGFGAWFPITAPTSGDSFWNVDRSSDVTRLAGVRFDGRNETIEEALIDGARLVYREGGMPELCFMNTLSFAALEKALGSKVVIEVNVHEIPGISFKGIQVHAPYGTITVIGDRNCPSQTAYLISADNVKLRSLGKAPHILTYGLEGLEGLRVGAADALEIRIGYYANLICDAPGWNAVIQLAQ